MRLLYVLIVVVPALAIAAPRARPRKPPAKTTKPVEPPAPAPDAAPAPEPAADPAKPAAPAAGASGSLTGSPGGGASGGGAGSGSAGGGPSADGGDAQPSRSDAKSDDAGDVDSLRQEYLSLRDELFKSRARASAVASQLYSTRIQIKLTYTSARYYTPAKASIRLDGASVYEDASGAIGGDDGVRFDGYVAPGRHLVTFRVEATGKDDDTFSSVTETQIVVKAVPGKDLIVAAKARDSGDIAYEWKKKEKGSYGLAVDVAVRTTARAKDDAAGDGPPAAKPAAGASK